MPSLSAEDIAAVRRACDAARANSADAPACLLELVKDWGGSVPPARAEPPFPDAEEDPSGPADPEVVAPEADAPVAMGPEVAPELSEREMDEVMETKQKAADAFADGRFEDAIDAYTVVIQSMPSALVYAKRAEAFVRLRKCVAAIRDCDAALALNPDSAKALKTRGAANRFLGNWERAHADLAKGQAIDFDETSAEIAKVVAERYKAIHAARLKKEAARRDAEKAERERRAEAARKAREEAAAAANAGSFPGGFPGGGFPGGMPGMGGGMPNIPPELLSKLMSDPELMAAMQNPRVMAALQECMGNPAAFAKYQSDPEIQNLITKLSGLMGGGVGGMGGFGGGGGPSGPSSAGFEDVTDVPSASVEDVD
jgi:suppressor of tumorigenicity protein 13